nr:Hsp33 family molecular chaperone HslO [Clostridia bacterium]
LLPGADESLIVKLEESIRRLPPVSNLVAECASNEEALARILEGFEYDVFDELDIGYKCTCSREKYAEALTTIGRDDLKEMYDDGKPIETVCRFCGAKYVFTHEDLGEILRNS